VNVSDLAMARVRMGAMAVAFGIQHDLDLECLVHFTTRDRNLMAIERSCSAPTPSASGTSSR
jgi:homocysteine S-methyltransferase